MKIFVPSFFDVDEVSSETLSRAATTLEGAKRIAQEQADEWADLSGIDPEDLVWKFEFDPSIGEQRWKADLGDTELYIDELELIN